MCTEYFISCTESYEKGASKMDWLAIVSLIVGIFSIVLAIYSMVSTAKMQKRIVKICKNIRKLIDGKEDEN